MNIDISTLKKSRTTDFTSIIEKFENTGTQQKTNNTTDERFWLLAKDKAGNGSAVIRFLPNIEGDEFSGPWVTTYNFWFKGPTGKWYVEESLKTIGQADPALDYVNGLWDSKLPANIELAKQRGQRTHYTSNILVISDPANPENNGKVFMFCYGKAIFNKLMGKLKPTFEDDEPINPFDLWEGCNFRFRMRKKDGYTNYDDSTFSDKCELGDDDFIVETMKKRYNLQEFLNPAKFKSYDELKEKLVAVLSGDGFTNKTAESIMEDVPQYPSPSFAEAKAPSAKVIASPYNNADEDDDSVEDDTLAFFKKMALED